MKKLHFHVFTLAALLLLAAPVYTQVSSLSGKWEVKTANTPAASLGTINFDQGGNSGTFNSVKGGSYPVKNIRVTGGTFSFNVVELNLKFDSLAFSGRYQLKGFLIEGKAFITNRKFPVALTKLVAKG